MSLFVPEGPPPNLPPALTTFIYKVESTVVDTSTLGHAQITHLDSLPSIKAEAEDNLASLNVDPLLADDSTHLLTELPRKRKASEMMVDLEDEIIEERADEDNDEVLRHDPASEAIPRLPLSHPGFSLVEVYSSRMIQVFQDAIQQSTYQDVETKYLLEELKTHKTPNYGKDIKVGLIGDSGEGKSSPINSILGTENITVQADDGASCTYVVMEFVQSSPQQKTPFAAEVEFFCKEKCISMVKEMLNNYVKVAQTDDTEEEADEMEEMNAQTAIECFCALFGNKREFANDEAAKEYLSTATGPADTKIMKDLLRWLEDIRVYFNLGAEGDTVAIGSNDVSNLVEQFLPFTKTVRYARFHDRDLLFCPWPLVKLVRVKLNSPILKQGLILADLPGVSDINQARVNATNRYLQGCDYSIVVARIDRAETEAPVHRHILQSFRRRRSGSVMIACTRSDDIGTRSKQTFQLSPTDEEKLNLIASHVVAVDLKLDDLRKQTREAKGNFVRVTELANLKRHHEQRKAELDQEKTEIRIIARNSKVINGLSRKYRELTKDEALIPIFCVSNKVYMSYIAGYRRKELPAIQMLETKIPALRSLIYSLPSKGKFAALEHHCQTSLETLLSTIEMSCCMSKLKRKDHLIKIVDHSRESIAQKIECSFERFRQTEVEDALKALEGLQKTWIRVAKSKCEKLAKDYKSASHAVFVRNLGTHRTKKNPQANWNEIFLKTVPDGLDPLFDRLCDEECGRFATDVAQTISEVINEMDQTLRNDPAAMLAGAVKVFLENLRLRKKDIRADIEKTIDNLKKKLRFIHYRAITDAPKHYFTVAMERVYTRTGKVEGTKAVKATPTQKAVKAKSKHAARCEFFQAAVCAIDGPFNAIHAGVQEQSRQALANEQAKLKVLMDLTFSRIQHDFDSVCSIEEVPTEEGKQFRQLLLAMVDEGRQLLDGPIKGYLDLCRQCK